MLKKTLIKKITVTLGSLLIIFLIYLFPQKPEINKLEIKEKTNIVNNSVAFLIDQNNYVSRVNILLKNQNTLDKIKELIELLTIEGAKKEIIPNNFMAILPKDTKILNISLESNLLKINFSKEFLNFTTIEAEKILEALVYSLTEFSEVNGILIFIENELLTNLPNGKSINYPLNRDFGINKVYNIQNIKNTTLTTIYYLSKNNDYYYYVPVSTIDNNQQEKIEIIIEKLKSSPIYETNLMSYLASSTELTNYELLEGVLKLSFNNSLLTGSDKILEEVKYSINLSIKDNYDVQYVTYFVDDKEIYQQELSTFNY